MKSFHYFIWLFPVFIFPDDRLRLIHADVLENIIVDGKAVQYLTGNVKFTKRNMVITCDRAQFNENARQGAMTGETHIIKEDITLTCDSLHFDSPNDLIKTFGKTHIWDNDYDLEADSLNYYSELKKGEALGNATLTQKNQVIKADRLNYEKNRENEGVSFEAIGNVTIQESDRIAT